MESKLSKIVVTVILMAITPVVCAQYWRLAFVGNSIVEGTGAGAGQTYDRWLREYFWACTNIALTTNLGVSGSTISNQFNYYTNPSIKFVQKYRPAGGTNGMLFVGEALVNNVSFDTPTPTSLIWLEYSNYCYMAKTDGWVTVCFTCTSNSGWGPNGAIRQTNLNTLMRSNYTSVCDYLIDTALILPEASNPFHFIDGLHWTNSGHKVVATNIASIINFCIPPRFGIHRPRFRGFDFK